MERVVTRRGIWDIGGPGFTVEKREIEPRRTRRNPEQPEQKDERKTKRTKSATPIADEVSGALRKFGRFPKDWL